MGKRGRPKGSIFKLKEFVRPRYRSSRFTEEELATCLQVGKVIHLHMRMKRVGQIEVSSFTNISPASISYLIHGLPVRLSFPTILRLSQFLDIPLEHFFHPPELLMEDYAHVPQNTPPRSF